MTSWSGSRYTCTDCGREMESPGTCPDCKVANQAVDRKIREDLAKSKGKRK